MCCRVWSVLGWLSPEPVVPRVCLSLSGLSEGDWFCLLWFTLLGSAGLAGGGLHLSLHKSTVQIVTPTSRSTICTASFIPGWLPGPVVLPPDPPVLLYARVILICTRVRSNLDVALLWFATFIAIWQLYCQAIWVYKIKIYMGMSSWLIYNLPIHRLQFSCRRAAY
jgi:hypothetical protein